MNNAQHEQDCHQKDHHQSRQEGKFGKRLINKRTIRFASYGQKGAQAAEHEDNKTTHRDLVYERSIGDLEKSKRCENQKAKAKEV